MAARRWWPIPTSRALTARFIRTSARTRPGCRKLFTQFSFPGGIPSHVSPECPGSIHEGGELGYSLSHAFGAVFDNPDLIVACVVGDGEAETGPLATAWHSNKFLDPATDGAVLPILHLNGYKIANPTVLARIGREELEQLLRGYGWTPYFVDGHEPALMHEAMAAALDAVVQQIKDIQRDARIHGKLARPRWPMIVLDSPKGWTGPKVVDGLQVEGTFRSHQVPLSIDAAHPEHLRQLENWMKSYRPEELFDAKAACSRNWRNWRPKARGAWARTRTPTAACCCATCGCRISATTRSTCARRACAASATRACSADFCATSSS